MKELNVVSYIVLPNKYSIPEKILPDGTEVEIESIGEQVVFILSKPKDIWIWYTDYNEQTQKMISSELISQIVGIFLSAILGGFIGSSVKNKRPVKK